MDAKATTHIDDGRSRVVEWRFESEGAETGLHTHEFDYVVVPVTGGELTVQAVDGGETRMVQVAGTPYQGHAGTRHNVRSAGPDPIVFVEIEFTSPGQEG